MKTLAILRTDGGGYWSDVSKEVPITDLKTQCYKYRNHKDDPDQWGELMVFFDPSAWNIREDGLIYTDDRFLEELHIYLSHLGLPVANVCYSEQGMQGDDYVSLDVDGAFVNAFKNLDQFTYEDIVL